MLSPPINVKIQGFFKAFECFQALFMANLIFKAFSRQSCIFKKFSSLCQPCTSGLYHKNKIPDNTLPVNTFLTEVYSQVLWTVHTMPAGTNYRFKFPVNTLPVNTFLTEIYSLVLWTVYTMPASTNYRFTLKAITLYYNPLPMPIIKLQVSRQYITCQHIPHRNL